MGSLLAVDAGLRFGLAWFDQAGQLSRYRSQHVPNRGVLRRAARAALDEEPDLSVLVIEGGGPIADVWRGLAERRGVRVLQISAEEWREDLLLRRERRSGDAAKQSADGLARRLIGESGAKRPTSLRHDAAEAILAGAWAVRHLGWGTGEEPDGSSLPRAPTA
jgi:hypothetical protein